ncbi:MAG: ATP-binding protein [Anaerolineales bacterium]
MSPQIKDSIQPIPAALAGDLLQSVQEGIVVIDPEGRITFFNRSAGRITGWSAADALQQPLDEVLSPTVGRGKFIEQLASSEKMPVVNIVNRRGLEITLAITTAALPAQPGEPAQTAVVFRDVTEEDAAQRLRSYFLANISHEFRTPLSALKASVELLLEEIEDLSKAETVELVKSLHFSVTGLQTLIDNLLESVSIEAGRFHIRRRPTELNGLVADAQKLMQPLLERRNQRLVLDIPQDIPRADVDPMRLTQVLVNLISNASKYGPMDKPIGLRLALEDANTLKVSVSDQGSGIPLEERENIFRRFIRLDEKDKAQFGVGLGLSVVKTIVESHGGRVGLDARPGGGSVFWFTLPLRGG